MSCPSPEQHLSMFCHELVVGLANLEMHGAHSQEMQDSIQIMLDELGHLFPAGHTDPIEIGIEANCIYYNGEVLVSASLQTGSVISRCKERDIGGLRISPRVEADELRSLLAVLKDPGNCHDFRAGHGSAILEKSGIFHIAAMTPSGDRGSIEKAYSQQAMERYQALADCLQDNHIAAFQGHDLGIEEACGAIDAALSEINAPAGLLALASHDFIDSFTVGHSVRVALLALQVATAGGASRQDLVRVGTAGLLHDIGKSRIPQEVLFKRGPLTNEERQIMSQHPRLGGEVLLEQPQLDPAAIGAAFCHHMKPDGGYPKASLPFEPSGISKLVQVCDVFEALTAVRPYKRAMTPLEAYSVMFRNERDFDPEWLRFFVQALGVYPQGTFLALDTGEIGMVTAQGARPTKPTIQVLTNPDGALLPESEILTCSLGQSLNGIVRNSQENLPGNPLVATQFTSDPTTESHGADHSHDDGTTENNSCCGEDLVKE
jgi:putative nucleotidyltransferase with HDIG domain